MARKEQIKPDLHRLLRRRKITLARFVSDLGITTYDQLTRQCKVIGVTVPAQADFDALVPIPVTTPSEGLAVFDVEEPAAVIEEEDVRPKRRRKNALVAVDVPAASEDEG